MKQKLIFLVSMFCSLHLFSQDIPQSEYNLEVGDIQKWPASMVKITVSQTDTLVQINYYNVRIAADMTFTDYRQAAAWDKLKRDVKKVYPYAILISAKVRECDKLVEGMNEIEKRKYMDKVEKELKEEFESAFRSNTVNQAKVLIKLVDRETGHTSHELIKRFKGGFSAFMWQSFAVVCGTNLKSKYDSAGDDKLIEQAIYLVETGVI
jgi:hypothetical protein